MRATGDLAKRNPIVRSPRIRACIRHAARACHPRASLRPSAREMQEAIRRRGKNPQSIGGGRETIRFLQCRENSIHRLLADLRDDGADAGVFQHAGMLAREAVIGDEG